MKNVIKLIGIIALVAVIGFSFTACDDGGENGTAPTVTTTALPGGTVGTAYSQMLAATGDAPITWSKEGDLPDGLTLSAAGVISGTPTAANTFNFTVKAANAAGSGTKALSIVIAAVDLTGDITITPNDDVQTNTELTANYSGSEAVTYQWKKDGVDVGENADTYTPTQAGTYTVTVSAAGYKPKTSAAVDVGDPNLPALTGNIAITPNSGVQTNTELTANYSGTETVTYQWKKDGVNVGENSNKYTPTAAGSYIVTVRADGYNPKTSGAVVVTAPVGTPDLPGDITISPNSVVQINTELTANYSGSETVTYQWKKDGVNVGTASTTKPNKYTPTAVGSYTVTVSAAGYNPKTSEAVVVAGGSSMATAIPLTLNIWADGGLPANGEQWFTFTATASTQYIHVSLGTLQDLYVQVYDSSGTTVGDRTNLYTSSANKYISRTVSTGQTYYIKVTPYGSGSAGISGTYQIGFNTSTEQSSIKTTLPTTGITTLTLNQWADGNLSSGGEQWFTFTATADTQYIHASFGTLTGLSVQVYDSSGAAVGDRTNLATSSSNKYISRTVSTGQTYYIKVTPPSSSYSGTYQIAFNTSTTAPAITLPTGNITTLTLNTWADGNLPQYGEQWFTFMATADTQYIHASLGALTDLYVQVYNSSGATVETETRLNSSSTNKYISRTVSTGQTYYIKVTPYGYGSGGISGTYKIGFNTGFVPPGVIPTALTLNTWADGNLPANGEQWFTFTATITGTQYIHASFGTLTDLYVQVYNSSGATVYSRERLNSSSSFKYISLTVSTGQTYYIKVTPYGSGSGGISGTYQIGFNTGGIPPGVTPTALTLNTWADGNLPQYGEQWFTFTATADTQYIHASSGTLTRLWVQVYDSSGTAVGNRTELGFTEYISRGVATGQTYYIKVTPYGNGSGTYKIGFTASSTQPIIPPVTTMTTLTENVWADGDLPANGEQWFTFTATADTQYIHASFGTLTDLSVQVYNSSGATVGAQTRLNSSSSNKYISRTVSTGQTYYIKVTPYSSSYSGSYRIGFNTGFVPPGATQLTLNTWADGNLPANGEQWFSFTATASTQYIHASFGTLTDLYVQVYNSSGATVETETRLNSSSTNKYISRTVSTGQTYYIKVTPYGYGSGGISGTYKIGFNAIPAAPGAATPTALTLNTWADGDLPANGEQWFTFTATADTQNIHASFGTLTSLDVQVYDSSGAAVGARTHLYSYNKFTSRSVTTGQAYYIKVTPYSSSYSGTYKIAFNAIPTAPGVTPTALTLNTWVNGNLPLDGEQWFTFTATASPQYIHADFGTLVFLDVQVYDSSGVESGGANLDNSKKYIYQTVSTGQTYYIRVRPGGSGHDGTYWIVFNTSSTRPN